MELILACVEQEISGEVSQARELVPSRLRLVEITIYRMSRNYRVNLTLQSYRCAGVSFEENAFLFRVKSISIIQDKMSSGYKILFFDDQPPPKFCKRNNKSVLDNSALVFTELKKLESLGWLVVLSLYNPFCVKRKIQLSNLSSILKILEEGDFMACSCTCQSPTVFGFTFLSIQMVF